MREIDDAQVLAGASWRDWLRGLTWPGGRERQKTRPLGGRRRRAPAVTRFRFAASRLPQLGRQTPPLPGRLYLVQRSLPLHSLSPHSHTNCSASTPSVAQTQNTPRRLLVVFFCGSPSPLRAPRINSTRPAWLPPRSPRRCPRTRPRRPRACWRSRAPRCGELVGRARDGVAAVGSLLPRAAAAATSSSSLPDPPARRAGR